MGESMSTGTRPRVAIVGGFYLLDADEQAGGIPAGSGKSARDYAEELGGALADAGFDLVVYFSNDQSLEPHVVRGFAAAIPPGEASARIAVRYSEAQQGQVNFAEQAARPELFHVDAFPGQNWEAPFYRSLAARDSVDAVLLMAGGKSTLNAGQVAVGRGLPLLAIDRYPGSAKLLRTELATRIDGYPSAQSVKPAQLAAWLQERLRDARAREAETARAASRQRSLGWFALALLALVGALGLGLWGIDSPRSFVVLMGGTLLAAGATGALVRGLIATSLAFDPRLAALLGVVAGLVVGLAYLIPQLIGAPDLLDPKAMSIKATDKIQFLSVTLVAFTAGIGFDTIFRRMLQEAEEVPVSVARR